MNKNNQKLKPVRRYPYPYIGKGILDATIRTWEEVFSLVQETRISIDSGISFYAFRNRQKKPTLFSIQDMQQLAKLFGIEYDTMHNWVRQRCVEVEKERKKLINQSKR